MAEPSHDDVMAILVEMKDIVARLIEDVEMMRQEVRSSRVSLAATRADVEMMRQEARSSRVSLAATRAEMPSDPFIEGS